MTKRFFGTVCQEWCPGTDESAAQTTFLPEQPMRDNMNLNEFILEAILHGNRYAEQKGIVYSSEKGTVNITLKNMNEPIKPENIKMLMVVFP